MPFGHLLGRVVDLQVRRFGPPGAFLSVDASDLRADAKVILLPGMEIPEGTKEGDPLHVFVYLDSEDRPIATVHPPKLTLGEVAFLAVTDTTHFGAFVDWGLPKELLVPHAERTRAHHTAQRHTAGTHTTCTTRQRIPSASSQCVDR